jgi:hypothetical protein
VRAVRENIQPRSLAVIQQDGGWIFSRTARTVEVSKFFIIWHCSKKWEKRSREGKAQSPKHLQKKQLIVKSVLLVSKTTLQHFLYRILTQFG